MIPTVNYNSALLALGLSSFFFTLYIFLRGICVHIGVLALPGNLQPSEIDLQSITSRCDVARARFVSFRFFSCIIFFSRKSKKILRFFFMYKKKNLLLCWFRSVAYNIQHTPQGYPRKTGRPAATCFCKSGSFFHNHHQNFPPIFGCFSRCGSCPFCSR